MKLINVDFISFFSPQTITLQYISQAKPEFSVPISNRKPKY